MILLSPKQLIVTQEKKLELKQDYIFDGLFESDTSKDKFYDKTCRRIVDGALQGYNGGIICYGETGTGKTYTINEIIPQVVSQIFEYINQAEGNNELFKIDVSIIEIYKEQVNDLIDTDNKNLNLIEQRNKILIIDNLTHVGVSSKDQLSKVINKGFLNRNVNTPSFNSKSHFIIMIVIYNYLKLENCMKIGKLNIVDLEGSERISKINMENEPLEEQKLINKSLIALSRIVQNLLNASDTYAPYRESKLTRIISDCFGGNAYTSLILNCSKHELSTIETRNTLMFGEKCKHIKNRPVINYIKNASQSKILGEIFGISDVYSKIENNYAKFKNQNLDLDKNKNKDRDNNQNKDINHKIDNNENQPLNTDINKIINKYKNPNFDINMIPYMDKEINQNMNQDMNGNMNHNLSVDINNERNINSNKDGNSNINENIILKEYNQNQNINQNENNLNQKINRDLNKSMDKEINNILDKMPIRSMDKNMNKSMEKIMIKNNDFNLKKFKLDDDQSLIEQLKEKIQILEKENKNLRNKLQNIINKERDKEQENKINSSYTKNNINSIHELLNEKELKEKEFINQINLMKILYESKINELNDIIRQNQKEIIELKENQKDNINTCQELTECLNEAGNQIKIKEKIIEELI